MNTQVLTGTLCKDLDVLPHDIEKQEGALRQAVERLEEAKEALADVEADLLLMGVEGKNAEVRAAAMRRETEEERRAVKEAEAAVAREKIALSCLYNRFKAARSLARLAESDGTDA